MESPIIRARLEAMKAQHRMVVETGVWMVVWLVASPLVMASIKTLMNSPSLSFPYPWMLIGFSNAGVGILCNLLRCLPFVGMQETDSTMVVPWSIACALGLMQGIEVGIGADILHRISLTIRTEIHMLCPAMMYVGGVVVGVERLTLRLIVSVAILTVGGMLASYGTMTWDGLTLVPLALAGSLVSTVRWVLTQKWLTSSQQAKPSPVTLAIRMSPTTALVGFLVAAVREPNAYRALPFLPDPSKVVFLFCMISSGVSLMLVAEMRVVQLTSALLLAFMYPFHNVSVILFDAWTKGTKASAVNWLGIVLCAVASAFFGQARKVDKDNNSILDGASTDYQSTEASATNADAAAGGASNC